MNTAVFFDFLKMEPLSSPETPKNKSLIHTWSRTSRIQSSAAVMIDLILIKVSLIFIKYRSARPLITLAPYLPLHPTTTSSGTPVQQSHTAHVCNTGSEYPPTNSIQQEVC
jgi:hypothetical protein